MDSIVIPSSLLLRLPSRRFSPHHQLQSFISPLSPSFPSNSKHFLPTRISSVRATLSSNDEGPVSVINFEDFIEKDWSFLDMNDLDSQDYRQKISQIVSAGGIEKDSKVLVSLGSEDFIDELVNTSPASLLFVAHYSLFLLAIIKEKYDKVKCWQGELLHVPEKWAPLDVVFLYFLPALPFKLDEVFAAVGQRCSQGARVVISHPQGREMLEQQKKQHQDVVVSELPDKMTLQAVAANNSFEVIKYVDEPGLFLAVLRFSGARK